MKAKLFNPLNVELNPICHLLALIGAHHIRHVSTIRVNSNSRMKLAESGWDLPGSVSGQQRGG